MNKICLTVDIEDWYHIPAVTGSEFARFKLVPTFMSAWKTRYDYLTQPTLTTLEILKSLNLKATFFVLTDIIDYYPGLLEKIVENDHEIAFHSYHHTINLNTKTKQANFTPTEFEHENGLAKNRLEQFIGRAVIGYRAPGAYIGKWMFDSLINLGFKFDSSICPNSFYNKTDFDISKYQSNPFVIYEKGEQKLIELPWAHFKFAGFTFPTPGGPFLRFFPAFYTIKGLNYSINRGDTVFYFHSIDIINEKLPHLASSNSNRPFYFKTNGIRTREKLIKILSLYKDCFTTCNLIINDI